MSCARDTTVPRRSRAGTCRLLLLLAGLPLIPPSASSANAQTTPPDRAQLADPFAGYIAEASQRFGVPESWICAVMRVESRGDTRAVSPKGAMGLMQIMPATWAYLRARYGLGANPYDPRENILGGAAYLRELHDRYDAPGFLAAYNAGPGRYEEYRVSGRPLPAETVAYVAAIAPSIGTEPLAASVTAVAPDPLAWTRSALFAARGRDAANDPALQPESASPTRPTQTAERPAAPPAPPRDTIFVARLSDQSQQ
ncbi:lytic transglycosylase domain-containing protein [Sphingomonas guangdongensis]|uniref:lytic transglycosylase domain-containing protein n=1 Tax=Sphingomonas guangdongensis TaxID=1141890 RepID=UPI000BE3DFC2